MRIILICIVNEKTILKQFVFFFFYIIVFCVESQSIYLQKLFNYRNCSNIYTHSNEH